MRDPQHWQCCQTSSLGTPSKPSAPCLRLVCTQAYMLLSVVPGWSSSPERLQPSKAQGCMYPCLSYQYYMGALPCLEGLSQ